MTAFNQAQLPDMMSVEETQELYANWDRESWKILVERNMRLAIKIARSYESTTDIEFDDLCGSAYVGLVKAAKNFDPKKQYAFATFAVTVVRNELNQMIRRMSNHPYPDISLNEICGKEDGNVYERQDFLPDPLSFNDVIDVMAITNEIHTQWQKLSARNQQIVSRKMRGETEQEIGTYYGISQSAVSRIFEKFRRNVLRKVG